MCGCYMEGTATLRQHTFHHKYELDTLTASYYATDGRATKKTFHKSLIQTKKEVFMLTRIRQILFLLSAILNNKNTFSPFYLNDPTTKGTLFMCN